MSKLHKLSELLTKEMILFPKGDKKIIHNYQNWTLEIESKWNSKRIDLTIKSRKSNLHSQFTHCSIKKDFIMSIIARYDNHKLSGESSEISDLLLTSKFSLYLLKMKKASFELNGKYLVYNCRIGRSDKHKLSNIFILIEKIIEEIDKLTYKTS
ncbi:hypothetical protein [Polaribacter sp. SA4-12]|uniref:hypothetical protein n=1 Tax=Polaribacter sp. SA4-12 TaxID=1312072 RepID=UPI000B3D21A0|nr:hypothetical protein [Polaribacter sp. SA4-12]ARV15897.1 hypothetical protein BTO07_12425 [Polaribacter sp. SA4-12]